MNNSKNNELPKLAWYENNKDFTDPIKEYLEKTFEVKVCDNPDYAEKKIRDFNPDVVIFDYQMPYKSGIDMFKKLMETNLKFIPIFFTIWANDDLATQKIKKAGIDEDAIIDKHMACESFSIKITDYYRRRCKQ